MRRGVALTPAGLGVLFAPEPASALAASDRARSLLQAAPAVTAGRPWHAAGLPQPVVALARHTLNRMLLGRFARLAVLLVVIGAVATGSTAVLQGWAAVEPPEGLAVAELSPTGNVPREAADPFANPPGYVWAVRPQGIDRPELSNQRDVTATVETGPDGALVVTVFHPPRYSRAGRPYYRPVALDAAGRRFLFSLVAGSVKGHQAVNRYRLPPQLLQAADVRNVGVEELPPAGRPVAAADAARRARARGLEPLPLPEPGQPYDFSLTAEDGRPVRSRYLLGRVVVIHGWAYWSWSSLEQRDQLEGLYRRHREDGLEVVGIDLNNPGDKPTGGRLWLSAPGQRRIIVDDPGSKEKVAGPVPWANVRVPRDLADRELWELTSEIFALPRVLVLDRRGILRSDTPRDLEAVITALLREP
jgi:hypothetical protein